MLFSEPKIPQFDLAPLPAAYTERFSALQRAENSSIGNAILRSLASKNVSVLFSEPKIPQSYLNQWLWDTYKVSVLFSEPKIPQFHRTGGLGDA